MNLSPLLLFGLQSIAVKVPIIINMLLLHVIILVGANERLALSKSKSELLLVWSDIDIKDWRWQGPELKLSGELGVRIGVVGEHFDLVHALSSGNDVLAIF